MLDETEEAQDTLQTACKHKTLHLTQVLLEKCSSHYCLSLGVITCCGAPGFALFICHERKIT